MTTTADARTDCRTRVTSKQAKRESKPGARAFGHRISAQSRAKFFFCLRVHSVSTNHPQVFHRRFRRLRQTAIQAGSVALLTLREPVTTLAVRMRRLDRRRFADRWRRRSAGTGAARRRAALPRLPVGRHGPRELWRMGARRRSARLLDAAHAWRGPGRPAPRLAPDPSCRSGAHRALRRRVRAATYASNRGEADFAHPERRRGANAQSVAGITDPKARLAAAERARRALADWPGTHYGYRATEVREFVGVLDEVIAGLRASAGGRPLRSGAVDNDDRCAGDRGAPSRAGSDRGHPAADVGGAGRRLAGGEGVAAADR